MNIHCPDVYYCWTLMQRIGCEAHLQNIRLIQIKIKCVGLLFIIGESKTVVGTALVIQRSVKLDVKRKRHTSVQKYRCSDLTRQRS